MDWLHRRHQTSLCWQVSANEMWMTHILTKPPSNLIMGGQRGKIIIWKRKEKFVRVQFWWAERSKPIRKYELWIHFPAAVIWNYLCEGRFLLTVETEEKGILWGSLWVSQSLWREDEVLNVNQEYLPNIPHTANRKYNILPPLHYCTVYQTSLLVIPITKCCKKGSKGLWWCKVASCHFKRAWWGLNV